MVRQRSYIYTDIGICPTTFLKKKNYEMINHWDVLENILLVKFGNRCLKLNVYNLSSVVLNLKYTYYILLFNTVYSKINGFVLCDFAI